MHASMAIGIVAKSGAPGQSAAISKLKTALTVHELARSVNGDPRRGFFVGTRVASLVEWNVFLHPGDVFDTHGEPLRFLMIPFNLVMLGLAKIVWLAAYALSQLLWRNSQRAEYLADYLATKASGTDAMLAMLQKIHFGSNVYVGRSKHRAEPAPAESVR